MPETPQNADVSASLAGSRPFGFLWADTPAALRAFQEFSDDGFGEFTGNRLRYSAEVENDLLQRIEQAGLVLGACGDNKGAAFDVAYGPDEGGLVTFTALTDEGHDVLNALYGRYKDERDNEDWEDDDEVPLSVISFDGRVLTVPTECADFVKDKCDDWGMSVGADGAETADATPTEVLRTVLVALKR